MKYFYHSVVGFLLILMGFAWGHTVATVTHTCPLLCGSCPPCEILPPVEKLEPAVIFLPCAEDPCPICETQNCEYFYNDGFDSGYTNGVTDGMGKGVLEGRKQCNEEFRQYN